MARSLDKHMLSMSIFFLGKHLYLFLLSRGLHKNGHTRKHSWGSRFCEQSGLLRLPCFELYRSDSILIWVMGNSTMLTERMFGVLAKSATSLLLISSGQALWPALCPYFRLLAQLYLRSKASMWYWGEVDLGITADEWGFDFLGAQKRSKRKPKTGNSVKFERLVFGYSDESRDFTLCLETALTDCSHALWLVF